MAQIKDGQPSEAALIDKSFQELSRHLQRQSGGRLAKRLGPFQSCPAG